MESQVSLVCRFLLAHRPHKVNGIVIAALLMVQREEEDGGENGSDIFEVGVSCLAIFDLKLFLSCFEDHGELFRRHGDRSCLLA